ncbi:hypothetical protein FRC08_010086 [Ceratobasidium sp. 394]|nr:hypothetical protein FRC08_010086 [Ceratobasidium sp. 394]
MPAPAQAPDVSRPPNLPWVDAVDEQAGCSLALFPPANRPMPGTSNAATPHVPATREAGVPERTALLEDLAKAVAALDMEDIRAPHATDQAAQGKVKYKRRCWALALGQCHSCGILDTPEWCRGPDGQCTLCNTCGLHYAKLMRKHEKIMSSLSPGSPMLPPIDIAYLCRSARLAAQNSTLTGSAGRCTTEEGGSAPTPKSLKRTSGGSDRDVGSGRWGWGCREQWASEPTPAQLSFPGFEATWPYPLPLPQTSPNHATSPVQPTSLPLSLPLITLPSMCESYLPLMPPYLTTPNPGPYPPSCGPHGYAEWLLVPGSMSPLLLPGPWDHYAPGNNVCFSSRSSLE